MAATLCFIPCCKSKATIPDCHGETRVLTENRIPETWQRLHEGRMSMSSYIVENTRPCRALQQYNGALYTAEPSLRDDFACALRANRLDCYILSAGYGVVHAFDPIRPYEAEMKGRVATMWREVGLAKVIAELIHVSRARRVFGFFAGPDRWSGCHAKYRYFFSEGVRVAASSGAVFDTAVCFYRHAGHGSRAINGALGRALLRGLHSDFSPRFLAKYEGGRPDGSVIIRSEALVETALGEQAE